MYLLPFEPPSLTHSTLLGYHGVPGWAPCVTQQLPASYLFYTWWCIYVNATFSVRPSLSFPWCVHSLYLHLHSFPASRVINTIFHIPHICINIWYLFFSFDLLYFTLYNSSRSIHIYKWPSFVPFNGWVPFNIPLCDSITLKQFYLGFCQLPRKLLTSTHIHSRQET